MCVFLYNLTLFYSVSLIYFFRAATAFDIFGTDNAEELLTCGFQYPSLPISIPHFVASSSELIIIEINSESEFQQPADWNGVINQVKKLWHVV